MIWYIFLEKRGGVIKKQAKWNLYNNNLLIIDNIIECDINNNVMIYKEDNTVNKIDLNNSTYLRENEEFKMLINFKTSMMEYTLKENNLILNPIKISSNFKYNDNIITMKYKIEDEEKKIIIQLL